MTLLSRIERIKMSNKIVIASDHAGYLLKEQVSTYLKSLNYDVLDLGTDTDVFSNKCKAATLCNSNPGK